jgi:hypothetical protein
VVVACAVVITATSIGCRYLVVADLSIVPHVLLYLQYEFALAPRSSLCQVIEIREQLLKRMIGHRLFVLPVFMSKTNL